MKIRWLSIGVLLAISAIGALKPLSAQTLSTSQISGTVTDASGAAIANAEVSLTNTGTAQVHRTTTNSTGYYLIPNLPSGAYTIQVVSQGFEKYLQKDIQIDVGVSPEFNVKMSVGSVTQEIVVESNSAQVETASTGVGQVIDQAQVVDLPLNGRDPDQLISLAGVTTPAPAGDLNSNKNFPTITIAVAGGLPNGVDFILDGAIHNEPTNNLNIPQPMPDALSEFKVETSALPAQYGDHAAAAINAVTKSGTNQFHGDVFDFFRNYDLNAANFFNTSPYKDGLKRNQFGGILGGPIVKDKLFFFGGYEGTNVRAIPSGNFVQVPTQAMMNGDFSTVTAPGTAGCQSSQITLGAPFTTVNGVPNQLPAGDFNPQALAAMKHLPVATSANDVTAIATKGKHTGACGYVQTSIPGNYVQTNVVGRGDYTINSNNTLYARYFLGINNQPVPATPTDVLNQNAVDQYNRDQGLTVGDTYIFTQNLTNSARATANRVLNTRVIQPFFDPTILGINSYNNLPGFMGISVTGGFSLGQGATNPGHFNSTTWQLIDDVLYVHGKHEFTFGFDYIYALMDTVNTRPANGIYSFSGAYLSSNGAFGYADFFAGDLDSFSMGLADLENDGQTTSAFYGQDSWKLKPNLTINYGVRWEPYTPEHNSNDHVENFNMAAFSAGTTSKVYVNAPAGLLFDGDPGMPGNHYTFGKKDIIEPRIGLIWDPFKDGKTSVRAGYGMFSDAPQMFFNTRYSNSPPYGETITPTAPSGQVIPFSNPWTFYPGGDPFPALNSLSKTMPFPLEGVYVNSPVNIKPMYLEQWDFSIQRQVGTWLFGATYLANRTVHLPTSYEADPAIYDGVATTKNPNYNKRRLLYEQNPSQGQYYSTIGQYDDEGVADYNGALIQVQRRAKQMNIVANYTFSHCLSETETTELTGPSYIIPPAVDPNGRRQSYSNCDSDRRQVANLSMVLNAPSFTDRRMNIVAGGWQWSTIFTATSGSPFSITTGVDTSLTGVNTAYAVNPLAPSGSRGDFGANGYLESSSNWTAPAFGTFGPQRPLSLYGPASYELDMALQRNFEVHESQTVNFRWEVFNVPNEAIYTTPTSWAQNSSTFGDFTAAGNPRIMQVSLKYVF